MSAARSRFTPTVPAPRPPASSETRLVARRLVDYSDHRPCRPHELERLGWSLEARGRRGSKLANWVHRDGWRLEHCGHPTALTPWLLLNPRGARICTGAAGPERNAAFGTAWPSLRAATSFVAHPESRAFLTLPPELGR